MKPAEHVSLPRPEPVPAQTLKSVDEPRMLRFLLATSVRRLKAARKLEETRKIVYPETTCIVRDVERLTRRLAESQEQRLVRNEHGQVVATVEFAPSRPHPDDLDLPPLEIPE
jgi:hypothetical protein